MPKIRRQVDATEQSSLCNHQQGLAALTAIHLAKPQWPIVRGHSAPGVRLESRPWCIVDAVVPRFDMASVLDTGAWSRFCSDASPRCRSALPHRPLPFAGALHADGWQDCFGLHKTGNLSLNFRGSVTALEWGLGGGGGGGNLETLQPLPFCEYGLFRPNPRAYSAAEGMPRSSPGGIASVVFCVAVFLGGEGISTGVSSQYLDLTSRNATSLRPIANINTKNLVLITGLASHFSPKPIYSMFCAQDRSPGTPNHFALLLDPKDRTLIGEP